MNSPWADIYPTPFRLPGLHSRRDVQSYLLVLLPNPKILASIWEKKICSEFRYCVRVRDRHSENNQA